MNEPVFVVCRTTDCPHPSKDSTLMSCDRCKEMVFVAQSTIKFRAEHPGELICERCVVSDPKFNTTGIQPPTEVQKAELRKHGLDPDRIDFQGTLARYLLALKSRLEKESERKT